MGRRPLNKKSFDESDNLPDNAIKILQELDMLNDISNQLESIRQKLNDFPVYRFDEVASQRLEILKNSFNQFEFEILSMEQQYCSPGESMVLDLNLISGKVQAKFWAFETEIKTLETYLYRKC